MPTSEDVETFRFCKVTKSITFSNFNYENVGFEEFNSIIQSDENEIERVSFESSNMSSLTVEAFQDRRSLKSACLKDTFFYKVTVGQFLRRLRIRNKELTELTIRNYDESNVLRDTSSISAQLIEFLNFTNLTSLTLENFNFASKFFIDFCTALKESKTLTHLTLDNVSFQSENIDALKQALLNNPRIQVSGLNDLRMHDSEQEDIKKPSPVEQRVTVTERDKEPSQMVIHHSGPNDESPDCNISAQVLWGFTAALGAAAIAVAFAVFSPMALSAVGVGLVAVGAVALVAGTYGLFASKRDSDNFIPNEQHTPAP